MSETEGWMAEPPSGQWVGFYIQGGGRNNFTMQLAFNHVGHHFHGQCTDHEDNPNKLGVSDISGTWSLGELGQASLQFEKHYRRGHSVDYTGDFTLQERLTRVVGEYFGGADIFEMVFVEAGGEVAREPRQAREAALFGNLRAFYQQQAAESLADFSIKCRGGEIVRAHRIILASQSKFFEGFFRREEKASVALDFEEGPVRACLGFMFTGEVDLRGGEVVQVPVVSWRGTWSASCRQCWRLLTTWGWAAWWRSVQRWWPSTTGHPPTGRSSVTTSTWITVWRSLALGSA
jgi:hypothetical protein